jgi:hypothetical protein
MLRERVKTAPDDGAVWTAKKVAPVMAAELGPAAVTEQRGFGQPERWERVRRGRQAGSVTRQCTGKPGSKTVTGPAPVSILAGKRSGSSCRSSEIRPALRGRP